MKIADKDADAEGTIEENTEVKGWYKEKIGNHERWITIVFSCLLSTNKPG